MKKIWIAFLCCLLVCSIQGCGIRRPDPEEEAKRESARQEIEQSADNETEESANLYDTEETVTKTFGALQIEIPKSWDDGKDTSEDGKFYYYYDDGLMLMVQSKSGSAFESVGSMSEEDKVLSKDQVFEGMKSKFTSTETILSDFDVVSEDVEAFRYKADIVLQGKSYYLDAIVFFEDYTSYIVSILVEHGSSKNYREEMESLRETIRVERDGTDRISVKTTGDVQYQVPAGWRETSENSEGNTYYYADGFMLMVQNRDPGFDADYLLSSVDEFVSGITESMENCSNLRSGIRKIAGVDAIEVTVEFTSGKVEYEWHTNTFIIGSSMYSFVGMTEIGKDYSEEYEAIINSIVILSDSAADGEIQEEDSEVPSEGTEPESEETESESEETESESEETSSEETSARTPTTGERNALSRAKDYLSVMPFSWEGLVGQLEYEKYSHEEAVYAADHCGADWNEQAAKKAEAYLDIMSFSRQGLIDQLEYEGFTHDQAVYGAEQNGY